MVVESTCSVVVGRIHRVYVVAIVHIITECVCVCREGGRGGGGGVSQMSLPQWKCELYSTHAGSRVRMPNGPRSTFSTSASACHALGGEKISGDTTIAMGKFGRSWKSE